MRRLLLLKWIVVAGFLGGLLMSGRLWSSDREYPTLPLLGLPDLPQPAAIGCYWALLGLLVAVGALPRPAKPIYAAVALIVVLVGFDITRLQPWVYQYSLLLLAITLVRWDQPASSLFRAAVRRSP